MNFPLEDFMINNSGDIFHSWIFNNISLEKLNTEKILEGEDFPSLIKQYLFQNSNNKFKNISVGKQIFNKDIDSNIKLILNNQEILEKINFHNIKTTDLKHFIESMNETSLLTKLEKIKINNSNLISFNESLQMNNIKKHQIFKIKKFYIKNSLINSSMLSKIFFMNFSDLRVLILTGCGIQNTFFNAIYIILNKFTNLKKLNLSHNNFTIFDFESQKNSLSLQKHNLLQLDLSHNKLNSIGINDFFPNLKLLNISSNNFTCFNEIYNYINFYQTNCLIIANKNQFLINNSKINKYYNDYLMVLLNESQNIPINKLDLSFLRIINPNSFLIKLRINSLVYKIRDLNISFTFLSLNEIDLLFKNNNFFNLKNLHLNNNKLTDEIFQSLLKLNLPNLQYINLNENIIKEISSLLNISVLFDNFKNLQKLSLKHNKIEDILSSVLSKLDQGIQFNNLNLIYQFIENMKNIKIKRFHLIFSKSVANDFVIFIKNKKLDKIIIFE